MNCPICEGDHTPSDCPDRIDHPFVGSHAFQDDIAALNLAEQLDPDDFDEHLRMAQAIADKYAGGDLMEIVRYYRRHGLT